MVESFEGHCEYTRKEFETDYYQDVLKHLRKHRLEIKNFLDVGSCVGESARIYDEALCFKWLLLVEPIKENCAFIRGRFYGDSRVRVTEKAMFYGKESIDLHISKDSVGGANMFEERTEKRTFPTCTIESDFGPEIDFVKFDVEGGEINIIENSIYLKDIPFIEVEFHHYNQDLNREEFLMKHLPKHKVVIEKDKGRFLLEHE